jgi:hypothetical protein
VDIFADRPEFCLIIMELLLIAAVECGTAAVEFFFPTGLISSGSADAGAGESKDQNNRQSSSEKRPKVHGISAARTLGLLC